MRTLEAEASFLIASIDFVAIIDLMESHQESLESAISLVT